MTPYQIDLARRLVACPRWRWMPGMSVIRWSDLDVLWRTNRVSILAERGTFWLAEGWLPDLTDPATAGCLLAVLVAADPGAGWGVSCGPVGWRATSCDHDLSGATCGEAVARALVAALEEAP